MATTQNGYEVLTKDSDQLYEWVIPGCARTFVLRQGPPGFLLANFLLWFHDSIEPLDEGPQDDWGWSHRLISGSTVVSNHASGTAADFNAARHPFGTRNTFSTIDATKIRARLKLYQGAIRWGGDYRSRADEMHIEVDGNEDTCATVAKVHLQLPRGRRIKRANPSQTVLIR